VAASLLDVVEAFVELLDFLAYWRFWLPVLLAAAVTVFISYTFPDPIVRWVLGVPVILAGIVSGLVWHWKKD
jgi:uncharacterized membrane protein YccC